MKINSFLVLLFIILVSSPALAQDAKRIITADEFQQSLEGAQASIIGRDDFLKMQKEGHVVLLDVRTPKSFAGEHIKGSVNLPLTDITEKTLPKVIPDKTSRVILICENSFYATRMIALTTQAYPVLKLNGYKNVYQLNLWEKSLAMKPEEYMKGIVLESTPQK